jgi:hypothetical protein
MSMMTQDTHQKASYTTDAPPFPHHSAAPPTPLEYAERQHAEPPQGVPRWQPEEGDFS